MSSNYEYEPVGENSTQQCLVLDSEDAHKTKLYGLRKSLLKECFFQAFAIFLLGVPYAITSWYPGLKVSAKYIKSTLKDATTVFLKDSHDNCELVPVEQEDAFIPNLGYVPLRFFYTRCTKIVWIQHLGRFGTLEQLIPQLSVDDYFHNTDGLYDRENGELLRLYGPNRVDVEIKSYWDLFRVEVFNPFYVFQAFSVLLWWFDSYVIYAGCVVFLTAFSIITALLQTRKQSVALHDLVESSKHQKVTVLRKCLSTNLPKEVDPGDLVPGDLIVLPKANFVLPCDAVLLRGQCHVNESMLTGESVPVTKTSLHSCSEIYSPSAHKRHTLFSGTHMLQSRYFRGEDVLARVVKTGFDTTQGALVKSILFPAPVGIQFHKDSLKFVFVLFCIATCGMSYCLYLYLIRKAAIQQIVIRTLDIVTIVVPPALPAAMTVGIVYSQNRLKKLGIFCISPPRINVCGKVKLACFDKTGTLTHEGLDIQSVVPCVDAEFLEPVTDISTLSVKDRLVQGMATCHSLTQIDEKLTGDPLDLSMFNFTKWDFEEPGEDETARFDMLAPSVVKPGKTNVQYQFEPCDAESEFPYQLGIIKQFTFSSTLQCMSVLCRDLSSPRMIAFTKGAPEKLATMCQPHTLPVDFSQRLTEYASNGYRVIALAYKDMPAKFRWKDSQRAKRDIIECDLVFLGLLVMQNTLKPQSAAVIRTLNSAKIRTVMITGDNILTAISVARDCEMIRSNDDVYILEASDSKPDSPHAVPEITLQKIGNTSVEPLDAVAVNFSFDHCHFAMDGKTWYKLRTFYPDVLPHLLVRTTVFARFQPDQKTQLINHFQDIDYVVSMVGDGANDCGALKAAHVGVSLSQAEASVAAPFTSSIQDISCIVHLLLEGRCALVTSFAVFKYMALYSLIQFFTVLILYKQHTTLGDMQFLFVDLIITTSLAVTIGRQGPAEKLIAKRPQGSLFSLITLIPLFLQVICCGLIQVASLLFLDEQRWHEPVHEDNVVCWENTVLFTVSCFQYVILALVYAKGRPYRRMLVTNFWFLVSAVWLTVFCVMLLIYPPKAVAEFFEVMYLPYHATEQIYFRYWLMVLPLVHLAIAIFIEVGIADRMWFRRFCRLLKRKKQPKNRYKRLLAATEALQLPV